jgi:hypothetical protein
MSSTAHSSPFTLTCPPPTPPGEYQVGEFLGVEINLDPKLREFVARVATDPIVPVETSPLRSASIVALLHAANTTAVFGWAEAPPMTRCCCSGFRSGS